MDSYLIEKDSNWIVNRIVMDSHLIEKADNWIGNRIVMGCYLIENNWRRVVFGCCRLHHLQRHIPPPTGGLVMASNWIVNWIVI